MNTTFFLLSEYDTFQLTGVICVANDRADAGYSLCAPKTASDHGVRAPSQHMYVQALDFTGRGR
jgi:hypothetical protein